MPRKAFKNKRNKVNNICASLLFYFDIILEFYERNIKKLCPKILIKLSKNFWALCIKLKKYNI